MASQISRTRSSVGRSIVKALKRVPNSNHITELSCKHFKRGVLIVDGKYLHVKGFKDKIPLLWAFDEYSHDPLVHLLAPSENYEAYHALFTKLKKCNYPLQVLVCDEHTSILQGIKVVYPKVKIQLCLNHFKEKIRRFLAVRTSGEHMQFMRDVEGLFDSRTKSQYSYRGRRMLQRYYEKHPKYREVLLDISAKSIYLTTHYDYKCPKTTNLIECFNTHLEARVKPLRGFESFLSAEKWLNAYVMNRRLTRFTDCDKPYKYLNGLAPIQLTAGYESRKISLLKRIV